VDLAVLGSGARSHKLFKLLDRPELLKELMARQAEIRMATEGASSKVGNMPISR